MKSPVILASLLVSLPLASQAATVLEPAADAFVQLGNPDSNFSTGNITVKFTGGNTSTVTRKGYVRYDVSGLGGNVLTANLSLTVQLNNGGGSASDEAQNFTLNVFGLNDGFAGGSGILGESWAENAITWNNAPANIISGAGAGNSVDSNATLIGSFNVTASDIDGSVILAASGASLVDFLNSDTDGNATFIITRTGWSQGGATTTSQGNSNLAFHSKETFGSAPLLTVTTVPEPSVALLGLVGSLFLFRRRR